VPALLLLGRWTSTTVLLASVIFGVIVSALGLWGFLNSTRGPGDFSLAVLAVTPAIAAVYSVLALRRLPRD
jgi:hypothetical protein